MFLLFFYFFLVSGYGQLILYNLAIVPRFLKMDFVVYCSWVKHIVCAKFNGFLQCLLKGKVGKPAMLITYTIPVIDF